MITVTSVEARSRFSKLIDRSQREPVEVTCCGRIVAYVVSEHDRQELMDLRKRHEEAACWYSHYRRQATDRPVDGDAPTLTDADVNQLLHELR